MRVNGFPVVVTQRQSTVSGPGFDSRQLLVFNSPLVLFITLYCLDRQCVSIMWGEKPDTNVMITSILSLLTQKLAFSEIYYRLSFSFLTESLGTKLLSK